MILTNAIGQSLREPKSTNIAFNIEIRIGILMTKELETTRTGVFHRFVLVFTLPSLGRLWIFIDAWES